MSGLIGPLKWTSSNTNVATVNSSGKVSAKKSGNTTVTVSVGNLSASCNVTVKEKTQLLRMKKSIRIIWPKWILLTALQL